MKYIVRNLGNSVTPTDASAYTRGATVPVAENTGALKKEGFRFNGWNTKPDGSGTSFTADGFGRFVLGEGNVILYAKWKKKNLLTDDIKYDLPPNKELSILFNLPIDGTTLQNNIVIRRTDEFFIKKETFAITPVVDPQKPNVVMIKHTEPFAPGATYELTLNDRIKSDKGKAFVNSFYSMLIRIQR